MSERGSDKSLSALPQPKSPKALDEQILVIAREQAPQPQKRSNLAWLGGMASACVLVVAVLISGVPTPFTGHEADKDASHALRSSYSVQAKMSLPDRAPSFDEELSTNEETAMREQRQAKGFAAGMDAEESVLADALPPEPPKRSGDAPDATAIMRVERGAVVSAIAATPVAKASTKGLTLHHCEQLLEDTGQKDHDDKQAQKRRKEAQSCYELLRLQCPDCNLPETIEKAIEQRQKMKPEKERETGSGMR